MPKPTTIPTWATDATFTDPGETWDGASNKTDPGAGKRTQGYVPTEMPGPEQFNFDQNLVGDWLAWLDTNFDSNDDHVYPDAPRSRTVVIHPGRGSYGPQWVPGIFGTPPNQGWRITTEVNLAQWFFPLGRNLPNGAILQSAQAMVAPGAARTVMTSVPGDNGRMTIHLFESILGFAAGPPPTETYNGPLGAAEDDGSTDRQNLAISGFLPIFVTQSSSQYVIVVTAGDTAAASKDDLIGLELTFDDSGLRNF